MNTKKQKVQPDASSPFSSSSVGGRSSPSGSGSGSGGLGRGSGGGGGKSEAEGSTASVGAATTGAKEGDGTVGADGVGGKT